MTKSGMKGARLGLAVLGAGTLLAAAPANAQASMNPGADSPGAALSRNLRTLAANPKSLSALMGAGKAALELGDAQAAITFFGRAEEQAPRDGRIKMWIGAALVHLQQPQAALKFFQEAVNLGVAEGEVARERGLAWDISGDPRRAQRDYRLALQRGGDAEVARRLALSLAISGEREPALQLLEDQLLARDRAAERTRAFVLALTGDAAGAVRTVQTSMPGAQGAALAPFLERLTALTPAERALAVHLGHFPQGGRNLPGIRTDTYASVDPAVRAGTVDPTQSGLGRRRPGSQAATPATTAPRQAAPAASSARTPQQSASAGTPKAPQRSTSAGASKTPQRSASTGTSVRPTQQTATPGPAVRTPQKSGSTPLPAVREQQSASTAQDAAGQQRSLPERPSAWAWSGRGVDPRRAGPSQTRPVASAEPERERVASAQALRSPAPLQLPAAQPAVPSGGAAEQTTASAPDRAEAQAQQSGASAAPAETVAHSAGQRPVETADAGPAQQQVLSAPGFSILGSAASSPAPEADAVAPGSADSSAPANAAPATGSRLADVAATIAALPEAVEADRAPASAAPGPAKAKPAAAAPKKPAATAAKAPAAKKELPAKKPPAEPSRHWVQIAGGADKAALPREFARLKSKAPKLFGARSAWTAPLRATNRLLVGPFKTEGEAQAFVNEMKKASLSAFAWTSDAGQKIEKLAAK